MIMYLIYMNYICSLFYSWITSKKIIIEKKLEYHFETGEHIVFDSYTINENGEVKNNITGKKISLCIDNLYYRFTVVDNNKKPRKISLHRALASTFIGKPPTIQHSVDHINNNYLDNRLDNIRWASSKQQIDNRNMPSIKKSAVLVVKDNIENTVKEWAKELKCSQKTICEYARLKLHGFSYLEFSDLKDEKWKYISNSKNSKGIWEISNLCRARYITNNFTNVIWGDRFYIKNGYPSIRINNQHRYVHDIVFEAFYPEVYKNKKQDEVIRHLNDDKLDFRPENLVLGSYSDNTMDAHNNGKYMGTKTERKKCVSINSSNNEERHNSQHEAVNYLKKNGYPNACLAGVWRALDNYDKGKSSNIYGRKWKRDDQTL